MIIPIPQYEDEEIELPKPPNAERIREFLNVSPWSCPKCGTTMMGRMTYCVYCKFRSTNVSSDHAES